MSTTPPPPPARDDDDSNTAWDAGPRGASRDRVAGPPDPARPPWYRRKPVVVAGAVVFALMVLGALAGDDDADTAAPAATTAAPATTEPPTTTTTEPPTTTTTEPPTTTSTIDPVTVWYALHGGSVGATIEGIGETFDAINTAADDEDLAGVVAACRDGLDRITWDESFMAAADFPEEQFSQDVMTLIRTAEEGLEACVAYDFATLADRAGQSLAAMGRAMPQIEQHAGHVNQADRS